jgi:hypothetical protein
METVSRVSSSGHVCTIAALVSAILSEGHDFHKTRPRAALLTSFSPDLPPSHAYRDCLSCLLFFAGEEGFSLAHALHDPDGNSGFKSLNSFIFF